MTYSTVNCPGRTRQNFSRSKTKNASTQMINRNVEKNT